MRNIPHDVLIRCQVPGDRARWREIEAFALTYNGYRAVGQRRLGRVANKALETRRLPEDLSLLRAILFFEQRRWRHYALTPDRKAMQHIRSIVKRIRTVVRGSQRPV